ncbi:MAG: hypothetical protein M1834_004901 [Cirrosporium novae-zelandiae]|nr:MAG: hypothetical protein M1834_004901 [Cirrosporium novae-zelandiae]
MSLPPGPSGKRRCDQCVQKHTRCDIRPGFSCGTCEDLRRPECSHGTFKTEFKTEVKPTSNMKANVVKPPMNRSFREDSMVSQGQFEEYVPPHTPCASLKASRNWIVAKFILRLTHVLIITSLEFNLETRRLHVGYWPDGTEATYRIYAGTHPSRPASGFYYYANTSKQGSRENIRVWVPAIQELFDHTIGRERDRERKHKQDLAEVWSTFMKIYGLENETIPITNGKAPISFEPPSKKRKMSDADAPNPSIRDGRKTHMIESLTTSDDGDTISMNGEENNNYCYPGPHQNPFDTGRSTKFRRSLGITKGPSSVDKTGGLQNAHLKFAKEVLRRAHQLGPSGEIFKDLLVDNLEELQSQYESEFALRFETELSNFARELNS